MILFHRRNYNDFIAISACSMQENKIKIKKVQRVCLILACIAAAGLIGCGKTDKTPKKHEAITFMAHYMDVDSFIEEVHKTYPEIDGDVELLIKVIHKLVEHHKNHTE